MCVYVFLNIYFMFINHSGNTVMICQGLNVSLENLAIVLGTIPISGSYSVHLEFNCQIIFS